MRLCIPDIDSPGRLTTQQEVYLRLRNALLCGLIAPGTALTMRGLAADLGYSPTPVREALRRLAQESAISTLGNRRMEVPHMSRARFENLIAARLQLEQHAARRALPFVGEVELTRMCQIDTAMDEALREDDLGKLTRLNLEFHRTFYGADPDQIILPLVESIWLQLGPFQRQAIRNLADFYADDHHKRLLSALRLGDKEMMCDAIERDIEEGVARAGRRLLGQIAP